VNILIAQRSIAQEIHVFSQVRNVSLNQFSTDYFIQGFKSRYL
jgi:hypothetical protein